MIDEVNNILIIGSGNISWHLEKGFKAKGINVNVLNARDFLNNEISYKELFLNSDLVIIAVIDSVISILANRIFQKGLISDNQILVHTSGSIGMEVLENNKTKYGVFYPLQTFTKGKEVDFSIIPFCIEANNPICLENLKRIASLLSNNIYEINSIQRKKIHISAVFACNFVNHLLGIAKSELDKESIPFEILFPLIDETISKAKISNPFSVQTGPAKRKDIKTMESHLMDLEEIEKEIYKLISQNIINKETDL